MKIVVCDAGPIIHLYEANILHLLRNTGEIFLPHGVLIEVLSFTDIDNHLPDWIQVNKLCFSELKETEMWAKVGDLHKGESEALVLSKIKQADWLLTDDSVARLFASLLGLEVHGSLGVVLWNLAKGYISRKEAEQALSNLQKSSLWLSANIFEEARTAIIDIDKSTKKYN